MSQTNKFLEYIKNSRYSEKIYESVRNFFETHHKLLKDKLENQGVYKIDSVEFDIIC